jgi:hypothetical protein
MAGQSRGLVIVVLLSGTLRLCAEAGKPLVMAKIPLTMATATEVSRPRKGQNFSTDEERQVCRSVLHISQDPIQGNGQRKEAFWNRIEAHYNQHKPIGGGDRPARSLETKWGAIKHDIAKFIGVHSQVLGCRQSGTSSDDLLQNALELYKVKHPKQQSFIFLHCWLVLKDVPRWMETPGEVRQRAVAASSPARGTRRRSTVSLPAQEGQGAAATSATGCDNDDVDIGPVEPRQPSAAAWGKRGRPCGSKMAKEEQKGEKQREHAMRAQARATADIAAANFKKAQILEDQAAVSLFTMPDDSNLSAQAREYLELRREEELEKLRTRIAEKKAEQARLKAQAEREAGARAAEVSAATEKRVPPVPIRPPSAPLRPSTQSPNGEGPETTLGSQAGEEQTPNGVGEDEFGDDDGDFNSGDGEFSEPDSVLVGEFGQPTPSFANSRRPHVHIDAEGGSGIGRDIISETQPQFPEVPAFRSEGETL